MIFNWLCNKTKCKAYIMTSYFTAKFAAMYQWEVTWYTGRLIHIQKRKKEAFLPGISRTLIWRRQKVLDQLSQRQLKNCSPMCCVLFPFPLGLICILHLYFLGLQSLIWMKRRSQKCQQSAEAASSHTSATKSGNKAKSTWSHFCIWTKVTFYLCVAFLELELPPDSIVVRKRRNPGVPFSRATDIRKEKKPTIFLLLL